MHYGSRSFTANGKITIVTRNPLAQELIGQRRGLSHYDKLLANRMYSCTNKWLRNCGLPSDPCKNGGYTGAKCQCLCPSGTSGRQCEVISQGYYDSLLSGCSENITTEGKIASPNYPNNYPADLRCVKWIQAPECHKVQLVFRSFEIFGRSAFCREESCCFYEILEIRTKDLLDGDIYCGTDILPGTVFTSWTNHMVLFFITRTSAFPGWSADVTFVPDLDCKPTIPPMKTESTRPPTPSIVEYSSTVSTPSPSTHVPIEATYTTTHTVPTTPGEFSCETHVISSTSIQWTSPMFGFTDYPEDVDCALTLSSPFPAWATMTLNEFALQQPNERGQCQDAVIIQKPFDLGQEE
ncbi:blastula protease 10-like [Macrobrachium nipponense]|uniref:blastula protease 10-like n=1 Tax=Macrobrachium nipponense TaxID=159736 RepID=UPI0030C7D772